MTSPSRARILDPLQRFAGTNGHCHLWAPAIADALGEGEVVTIFAKAKRLFDKYDWPEDIPLELHHCVRLDNGDFVDVEGRQSPSEMVKKFSVRPCEIRVEIAEVKYRTCADFAQANPKAGDAVVLRRDVIRSLSWATDNLPAYQEISRANWRALDEIARVQGVPEPEVADDYLLTPAP